MPYEGAFQTTILGRTIRFISRGKLLKYPDELELPDEYKTVPGGGEKRERWRSPVNAHGERRWRGSRSMSRVNQIRPDAGSGIDRSSSDDTVVEDREGPRVGSEGSGAGEKERDPNLVDWYSETDQENPYVNPFLSISNEKLRFSERTGQQPTKHL